MSGSERPVLLFAGQAAVLSEYGFFLIVADGCDVAVPNDDTFSAPLRLCRVLPDTAYFLSYPSMQEVDCTVESWSAGPPPEAVDEPYDEQDEVDVMLSGKHCSVTGVEDYLTAIPLPCPGRQRMRVRVSGRADSKRLYESNPLSNTDGIERWLIQIWPSHDD